MVDRTVLLRYVYPDGSLQAALPMRVVRDDASMLVAWLSPGSAMAWWALPDGSDPRTLPLADRFRAQLTTAVRTWQGSGVLRVVPAGAPYQVVHFWEDDGTFSGWYVNLERPVRRHGDVLETLDRHLDLVVEPDLSVRWKDADEAQAAVDAGHLPTGELVEARLTAQALSADPRTLLQTIGDWRDWRPPPGWQSPLPLPRGWDD